MPCRYTKFSLRKVIFLCRDLQGFQHLHHSLLATEKVIPISVQVLGLLELNSLKQFSALVFYSLELVFLAHSIFHKVFIYDPQEID